jgi:hypothetical protein
MGYPPGASGPPGMPYQGNAGPPPGGMPYPPPGAPPPRSRPWLIPLAIVILVVCVGCLAITIVVAATRSDATPTVVAANQPTSVPATRTSTRTTANSSAAASASAAPVVIEGCGSASISNPISQISKDISQWNRIVDSANPITDAWNALNDASGTRGFEESAGDQQLVALADAFLTVANKNLPALRAETSSGRFATLATKEVAAVEAKIAFVTPFRKAVAESDSDAWNTAVDASDPLETTRVALNTEIDNQCTYWRTVK